MPMCDELVKSELSKEEAVVLSGPVTKEVDVNGEVKKVQPALGEDHTIFKAFKTLEFWILFTSFLCGVGPGMTVMNNMGQMGTSLGYSDVSIFVSLLSIRGFSEGSPNEPKVPLSEPKPAECDVEGFSSVIEIASHQIYLAQPSFLDTKRVQTAFRGSAPSGSVLTPEEILIAIHGINPEND